MGSIDFDYFPARQTGSDSSRPIGSADAGTKITLTRIGRKNGSIVYHEEIPAFYRIEWLNKDFSLGNERGSSPSSHGWTRLAVRVPKSDKTVSVGRKLPGKQTRSDSLTLAKYPYSSGMAFWTPFKNPNTKGWASIVRTFPLAFASGIDLVRHLESLPCDYVETGNYLTASVSLPPQSLLDDAINAQKDKDAFVFGICEDVDAFFDELYHTLTVKKLREATENGTLQFAPSGVRVRMHQEVQAIAGQVLFCAIRQALAGLHNADIAKYLNQPVEQHIDHLYRNHINNLNRRYTDGDDPSSHCFPLQDHDPDLIRGSGSDVVFAGIDVELLPNVPTVQEIPSKGETLMIIAKVDRLLYLRTFDEDGSIILDEPLKAQSEELAEFEKSLEGLWQPHVLTNDERIGVLKSVIALLSSK